MELQNIFDAWAHSVPKDYSEKQWLLSKWELFEGIPWPEEKRNLMVNLIVNRLDLKKGDSLIDLGCGGGWLTAQLLKFLDKVYAIDFSIEMLKHSQGTLKKETLLCGEIGRAPIKGNSFRKILCYYVFINLKEDDYVERSILEIYRILQEGGIALIGQLPQAGCNRQYDQAKKNYIEFYRKKLKLGRDNSDLHIPPLKLFDRGKLSEFLKQKGIAYEFQPAFNPFYYEGQSPTINWRFDLIIKK